MAEAWVIWSFEHNGWWGPQKSGYYQNLLLAGIYPKDVAQKIEASANEHRPMMMPNEKAMVFSDALNFEIKRWRPDWSETNREIVAGYVVFASGLEW
jgi:hypothetical protein